MSKLVKQATANNRALQQKRKEKLSDDYDYAARSFARSRKTSLSVTIPRVPWHEDGR